MIEHLDALRPVTLAELVDGAALQERHERKYVVPVAILEELLGRLAATHRVLDIDGRRLFHYQTTYFDTPDLRTMRDHVQGRRRRFKLRRRTYVDSGRTVLEVKLKAGRGMTVKHALDDGADATLGERGRAFFTERVLEAYGIEMRADVLEPVLVTQALRLTLAAPGAAERLTADVWLDLQGPRLRPGFAVVESKTRGGRALADRALCGLRARPMPRLSKFVLGVGFLHPEIPLNEFARACSYFEPPLVLAGGDRGVCHPGAVRGPGELLRAPSGPALDAS